MNFECLLLSAKAGNEDGQALRPFQVLCKFKKLI